MKIRAVVILVGLAISFAMPIFAQEKEDAKPFPFTPIPAGPQLVQQIEAINQKFDEAFNKHDAAAVGQLYTSNAVQTVARMVFRSRVYRRIYYRFVSASAGFDRLVAGIL